MPVSAPSASPGFVWDLCFNVLLLAFWLHLWLRDPREALFNPYLATFHRLSSGVLHFLRPALLMLPEMLVACVAMLLVGLLRAFSAPHMTPEWTLTFGFETCTLLAPRPALLLLFTLFSFAIFLFKVWGLSLIYLRDDTGFRTSHTHGLLHAASRPFVAIPVALRPFVLLLAGALLAMAITQLLPARESAAPLFWRCLISSLAAWVSLLYVLSKAVFGLIILSLAGLLLNMPSLSTISRDWTDTLIGPLRRFPMQIGMFDFTPVVFIFAVGAIHQLLMAFLAMQYTRLVGG